VRRSKPYDIESAGERQLAFKVKIDDRVVHGWITFEAVFRECDSAKLDGEAQSEEAKARLARDDHGTFCSEIERRYREEGDDAGDSPVNPIVITYLSLYAARAAH
jgi:hypothetical protein